MFMIKTTTNAAEVCQSEQRTASAKQKTKAIIV